MPAITAFAVGGYEVSRPSLWRDEAYTIEAASRSPGQILAMLRNGDAVHGAYYLCMHVIITLFGRSATAVRMPSVVAMAVAAGVAAALGRRLAARQGVPSPALAGLAAGLLFALVPQVTRYAQEARSYATVTALATTATYLLVRALEDGGRRRWAWYAAAIALSGLFNLFSLLIVAAHAVTVGAARARARGWAVAIAAAAVVAAPVAYYGYRQRSATSWLTRPGPRQISLLEVAMAGSAKLIVPFAVLAVLAAAAALWTIRGQPISIGTVALPWLVLPPAVLLTVSQAHPVYNFRYVVFCLPAVSLLAAGGLGQLAWLTRRLLPTAQPPAAWLPSFAVAALMAVFLIPPLQAVRQPGARPDNLRAVAAVVAANARPGDAVLYLHSNARAVSEGYPGPFRGLWDVALAQSPVASANLLGTEVGPDVLRVRFGHVLRVWVIGDWGAVLPAPLNPTETEKLALISGLREAGRWHVTSFLVLLYVRP